MADYWLTQYAMRAVGLGYLAFMLIVISLALWLPKKRITKLIAAGLVFLPLSLPLIQAYREMTEQQDAALAYLRRLKVAQAMFAERCKTAGEKIYRTVEGVEGVFIIKQRTEEINYDDQFKLDDPYGYSGTGVNYLKLFIRGRSTIPTKIGELVEAEKIVRYDFIETEGEIANTIYRYTTNMSKEDSERVTRNGGGVMPVFKETVPKRSARYGITWKDISSKEDRTFWIAGSSQQIIDLENNEIIAERIGYMFDSALGDKSGGRSPWGAARANACPPLNEKTFYFFDRVIKSGKEVKK